MRSAVLCIRLIYHLGRSGVDPATGMVYCHAADEINHDGFGSKYHGTSGIRSEALGSLMSTSAQRLPDFVSRDPEVLKHRSAAALVEAPQDAPTEMATLDAQQVKRLLTAAQGDRLEALYVLAVTTRMWQGQLLGLRWQDLDLDHGSLAVVRNLQPLPGLGLTNTKRQKTEKSRHRVERGALAVGALRAHKVRQGDERSGVGDAWEDHDLEFPHVLGHPLSRERLLRQGFEPLLKAAGLPRIRFHDLRHTTATLLLSQGVHQKIVSELLGHSTVAITLNTYSHVTQAMSRAAADTLDSLLQQPPAPSPA
ncbi:MAG: site-specific integrase [Candidatus Dormibacteria bacterium]